MQDTMQNYLDVRTANELDLTVEQVRAVNACERAHQHAAGFYEPLSLVQEHEFEVEILKNGIVSVRWDDYEGIHRHAEIQRDGSYDWTCGGAFPEIAHWNTPA